MYPNDSSRHLLALAKKAFRQDILFPFFTMTECTLNDNLNASLVVVFSYTVILKLTHKKPCQPFDHTSNTVACNKNYGNVSDSFELYCIVP